MRVTHLIKMLVVGVFKTKKTPNRRLGYAATRVIDPCQCNRIYPLRVRLGGGGMAGHSAHRPSGVGGGGDGGGYPHRQALAPGGESRRGRRVIFKRREPRHLIPKIALPDSWLCDPKRARRRMPPSAVLTTLNTPSSRHNDVRLARPSRSSP